MKKLLGFISFLLVLAGSVSAKVVLPAIFSDNMVLQQNAQVNLWGKATPGERVSVKKRAVSSSPFPLKQVKPLPK